MNMAMVLLEATSLRPSFCELWLGSYALFLPTHSFTSAPNGPPCLTSKCCGMHRCITSYDCSRIEDALEAAAIRYDRLDGTMKRDERTRAMDALKNDPKCEVLLVSLRAGGVGLNLTAAQRVYLMDPYWYLTLFNLMDLYLLMKSSLGTLPLRIKLLIESYV